MTIYRQSKSDMAQEDHIKTFPMDIFPHSTISVAMFKDVRKIDELKTHIVGGEIDAAIVSSRMICDLFQILVAANKAVNAKTTGKLKTRNINSEVVFCLSPSNSITDSLKKFGVSPEDSAVIAVTVDDFDGQKMQVVLQHIDGEMVPLEQLHRYTDEDTVKKVYKINDVELQKSSLLDSVVTRIAVKEFAT